ncbi:MAG: two-component sensor histidine kinase [Burkholderiales bacterium]|nr:two-component sensor histidine kinase [Burkholderiales bacterium]MDE2395672.1 two-component sensor histidine kinase [Burkholderiales bacterium]MDE2452634.1 two-component sensor histidine kinase [Burkholderiales bacterium]
MQTRTLPSPAARPTVPATAAERRLRAMAIAAGLLVLLVAWIAVAAELVQKRADAIDAEKRQNTNLARAFEEQTVRVLASTDQATIRVRNAVAAGDGRQPDLVRFANETGLAPQILVQLSLTDANGRFIGSNLDPTAAKTGHIDLSQREHLRAHLAPRSLPPSQRLAHPDDLFIGKPVLGKVSNRWTIQLSRRIVGADGHLLGVVVASLDPAYFESVYERAALGRHGSIALVGTDLTVRARVVGGKSEGMGSSIGSNGPFAHREPGPEGQLKGKSTVDGIDRMTAFRQIANYPLYLLVSTSTEEALASWRATRNTTLLLTLVLSIAVVLGVASFVVNLRRLERSNAALRASEAQANSANHAKSEFLAAVSHELRTPLTSIRGFAELMEHRLENPKFREQAGLIRKGAEHLNELLTQILDLAKVEAGSMTLNSDPVDLRALVNGTADFFALAASAKGLALRVTIDPALPSRFVCDDLRLKQILNNLLSNAIKFTPSGSVGIAVEPVPGGVALHVEDTGPGIPEELHEIIFERFRQGNDRVSFEHGGTGLGLALSRALAELMKGRLEVASQVGKGSRFTLTLPLDARSPLPGSPAPARFAEVA